MSCAKNSLEYFLHNERDQTFSRYFIRKFKGLACIRLLILLKPACIDKVSSILAKKELHFNTVSPGSFADTALSRMCHENVDYLIVMDDNKYVGLLTEHDITSKVLITNKQLAKTKVSDIMNKGLPAATTD